MNQFTMFFNFLFKENKIISLILGIIFVEISLIFFQKIFKIQFSKKKQTVYILANSICFILGNLLGNPIYAYTLMLINSIILFIYLLKVSTLSTLSYFSLESILVLNLHFCIFKVISMISSYPSYDKLIKLPIWGISLIVLTSIIGFIIYFNLKQFKFDHLLIISINKKSNLIVITASANLIIVSLILFYFFEIFNQSLSYLLTLDIYFYFSTNNIIHLYNKLYAKQKIDNLKLCNKTILSMYDDTRAFKHDFHNIIQAIGGYILTNDMEGLKKYYSEISSDCKNSNNLSKLNPELINNPAIYNILADKYYIANNHNIQINLDVMLDLNNLNIKIYELTRILGILLDNAIEASKECAQKTINILFKKDKYKQILVIENTYSNKQISIDKIFEKDYSTKPHNTGLGLWEVKKILKKNSNLNLYTTKNNDYFSQQLEIYTA